MLRRVGNPIAINPTKELLTHISFIILYLSFFVNFLNIKYKLFTLIILPYMVFFQ